MRSRLRFSRFFMFGLFLVLCSLPGCRKDDSNPVGLSSPKIILGQTVKISSSSIPTSGGFISVDKPGHPLDGLEIDIEAGSYQETRTFIVSSTPITSHSLGPDFNPLTPLIRIENGGGYSEEMMSVFIPVTVPAGQFAAPFLYDRSTGKLEGLAVISYDPDGITIATRHFSNPSSVMNGLLKRGTTTPAGMMDKFAEIVVSSIDETKLNKNDYNSGFMPGVDDWNFVNFGSHLSSEGHCAGQSLSALWYYGMRKQTDGIPLWGRFDNDRGDFPTPKIWQDDVSAYRFCSVLQEDLSWNSLSSRIAILIQRFTPGDVITMKLLKYAIDLTGEPQFIAMSCVYDGNEIGHAMLAYRVIGRDVFVADPNHPGNNGLFITLSGQKFLAFNASNVADSKISYNFNSFAYIAAGSIIGSSTIAQRWNQLLNKTIGNSVFPSYIVKIMNDNGDFIPLQNNAVLSSGDISLILSGTALTLKIQTVDAEGNWMPDGTHFSLPKGIHSIGVYVSDESNKYVGFQWFRIQTGQTTGGSINSIWSVDGAAMTGIDTGRTCLSFLMDPSMHQPCYFDSPTLDNGHKVHMLITGNFNGVGSYPFPPPQNGIGMAQYIVDPNTGSQITYTTATLNAGQMEITEYDEVSKMAAGRYSFKASRDYGSSYDTTHLVTVTGQFRCRIKP